MIINPIRCENCKSELQPEDIGIDLINNDLIKVCLFCANRIYIDLEKKE